MAVTTGSAVADGVTHLHPSDMNTIYRAKTSYGGGGGGVGGGGSVTGYSIIWLTQMPCGLIADILTVRSTVDHGNVTCLGCLVAAAGV